MEMQPEFSRSFARSCGRTRRGASGLNAFDGSFNRHPSGIPSKGAVPTTIRCNVRRRPDVQGNVILWHRRFPWMNE